MVNKLLGQIFNLKSSIYEVPLYITRARGYARKCIVCILRVLSFWRQFYATYGTKNLSVTKSYENAVVFSRLFKFLIFDANIPTNFCLFANF